MRGRERGPPVKGIRKHDTPREMRSRRGVAVGAHGRTPECKALFTIENVMKLVTIEATFELQDGLPFQ
jgi:hypothetical protein